MVIKICLVGASALATVLHFVHEGARTADQYWGIAASLVVFVCGLTLLITEHDASDELATAHSAIDKARRAQSEASEFVEIAREIEQVNQRTNALYLALLRMRDTIASAVYQQESDTSGAIRTLLEASGSSLKIACDFKITQHFTICVYEAREEDPTSVQRWALHCVAHERSQPCELINARKWPSGVGAGGYAFAINEEVIVDDMLHSGLNSALEEEDHVLYRSIAAVPIRLPGRTEPWGVAIGTSDEPGHFRDDDESLQNVEPIRGLAGMVGLTVAVLQSMPSKTPVEESHGALAVD